MFHPTPLGYPPREIRENFMHANILCYTVSYLNSSAVRALTGRQTDRHIDGTVFVTSTADAGGNDIDTAANSIIQMIRIQR